MMRGKIWEGNETKSYSALSCFSTSTLGPSRPTEGCLLPSPAQWGDRTQRGESWGAGWFPFSDMSLSAHATTSGLAFLLSEPLLPASGLCHLDPSPSLLRSAHHRQPVIQIHMFDLQVFPKRLLTTVMIITAKTQMILCQDLATTLWCRSNKTGLLSPFYSQANRHIDPLQFGSLSLLPRTRAVKSSLNPPPLNCHCSMSKRWHNPGLCLTAHGQYLPPMILPNGAHQITQEHFHKRIAQAHSNT